MKTKKLLALLVIALLAPALVLAQELVYLPMVVHSTAPLQGAALFADDCQPVQDLALDWYYIGPESCPSSEYVHYRQEPGWSGAATPFTMIYNEPEMNGWSINQMVADFVPYANANPGVTWVGPCVLWDLDMVPAFWNRFAQVAGYSMPKSQIRFCFHCYYDAAGCMGMVDQAHNRAAQMGLAERSLWLTEFGRTLGLDRTMNQQLSDTQTLISSLASSPYIERYAYWPALYWPLPSAGEPWVGEPGLAAVPLLYPVYTGGGRTLVGYNLTAMGKMYKETW